MSLRDFSSKEVCALPQDEEVLLRFDAVVVLDRSRGELVKLKGPVDLDQYGTFPMQLTNPRTGFPMEAQGVRLMVCEENGTIVSKPLNVVSKRLIGQLHGDLESGEILRTRYAITAIGAAPKTQYQIRRTPVSLEGIF